MSKLFSLDDAVAILVRSALEGLDPYDMHEMVEYHYDIELSDGELNEITQAYDAAAASLVKSLTNPDKAYKTVIPSRTPVEKTYSKLGTAKSSISYSGWRGIRGGKLYELRHGTWHLLYDVAPGTDITEVPWNKK